jgi:hypothetical protein
MFAPEQSSVSGVGRAERPIQVTRCHEVNGATVLGHAAEEIEEMLLLATLPLANGAFTPP